MNVAVASGKGGTGKTTLAVSLAKVLAERQVEEDVAPLSSLLLDCDVEAPNAHLFLDLDLSANEPVNVLVPSIDPDRCALCGDCVEACRFNALAILGQEVAVFPELCHGCGSCAHVCQVRAITEVPREVGILEKGEMSRLGLARGVLNVGEAMAVPVIRHLKGWEAPGPSVHTVLDAPPGTSCPVVETISGADFVLLVTEPTPFGLHDLELAVAVVRELDLPFGVVINRDGIGTNDVEEFCDRQGIPVLLKIPFHREIAEGIAKGESLLNIRPDLKPLFDEMVERIAG